MTVSSAGRCHMFQLPPPIAERRPSAVLPCPDFTIQVPLQQYQTVKVAPIPFDPRVSNGGKFQSLADAMMFLGKHCMFHHKAFTRNLARMYLPFCRILSLVRGGYVATAHMSKREFDAEFSAASRILATRR